MNMLFNLDLRTKWTICTFRFSSLSGVISEVHISTFLKMVRLSFRKNHLYVIYKYLRSLDAVRIAKDPIVIEEIQPFLA